MNKLNEITFKSSYCSQRAGREKRSNFLVFQYFSASIVWFIGLRSSNISFTHKHVFQVHIIKENSIKFLLLLIGEFFQTF